ncbi:MAG: hypothetical protein M3279_06145 [Actinomycetota bacterium]|nr:hypothetical protein [Actinomycetota bacterium]
MSGYRARDAAVTMDASPVTEKGEAMGKRRVRHGIALAGAALAAGVVLAAASWGAWVLFLGVFWEGVEL